jgi:hypothetical protein
MELPRSSGPEAFRPEAPQNEVVYQRKIDFSDFLLKYERDCKVREVDADPVHVEGTDIHRDLDGVQFELYPLPLPKERGGKKKEKYLIGIKFTGGATVDWARFLQEIALECGSVEEAEDWLRMEAVIRAGHHGETTAETSQRLAEEAEIERIIGLIHDADGKGAPSKKAKDGRSPLAKPKPATV